MIFNSLKPHLIAAGIFLALSVLYCYPMLQGKMLYQNDMIQGVAQSNEAKTFYEKTGELSLWTNSAFSGMPTIMLYLPPTFNFFQILAVKVIMGIPIPINALFFTLLTSYILFVYLNIRPLLAGLGSFCITFCSYSIISLEAGHVSKILAFGFIPGFILGVMMLFDRKYISGLAVLTLFSALEFFSNHIQITYYLILSLSFYGIWQLIQAIKTKELKHFFIASGLAILSIAIGAATFSTHLLLTNEYGKETIRGGSELTSNKEASGGLDKDYAFSYSEGILEPLTLIIPNLYGGGSGGKLSENSETVSTLISNGVPKKSAIDFASRLPLYWGDQPMVSGPLYAGALVIFFFVLATLVLDRTYKVWLMASITLMILIAWGKSFPLFGEAMFNYFPLYNKFRAVTMAMGHANLFIVLLAIPAIKWITDNKSNPNKILRVTKLSLYITCGLLVFFALMGSAIFEFTSPNDEFYRQNWIKMTGSENFGNQIMNSIISDRESLLRMDAIRSIVFILLGAGTVYFFAKSKLSETYFIWAISLLCFIDLIGVDSRYFGADNFVKAKGYESFIKPNSANLQIMEDKDVNFRVMDLVESTFNSGTASFFHNSIGGYHGAKIRRYQEVIENHIAKNNMKVLNMLNTKYFIVKDDKGGPQVQRNPEVLGNAWLVNEIIWVKSADEEIASLKDFDPSKQAIVDEEFKPFYSSVSNNQEDKGSIRLTSYAPNKLVYEFNSDEAETAVFSEIYYRGNIDWKSYLDGVEMPHFRANYILRAMSIPAGKHTIEFRFDPQTYHLGDKMAMIASILLFGIVGFAGFRYFKSKQSA